MKKILTVLLIASLVLCSVGCTQSISGAPLTVNGTEIADEVFRYYLDIAFSNPENTSSEERITEATNSCIRYIAVNSAYKEKNLALSSADSACVSQEVNALWNIFSAHYIQIGVSKETLCKIYTHTKYIEKLRLALYDTNGSQPIDENLLKAYFDNNYATVKTIRGYLYTYDVYGNTVEYTEEQMQEIFTRYSNAVRDIDSGYSIDFVYSAFVQEGDRDIEQNLSAQLIYKGCTAYPEGLYEKVMETAPGKALVCLFDDYIYLVYRQNVFEDTSFYENHRYDCLEAVSEASLQQELNRLCSEYTSVRKMSVVKADYAQIEKVKNNQ